jgi:hypothetical protein
MSETMYERVVNVLDQSCEAWGIGDHRIAAKGMARLVFEAMYEPTEGMLAAFADGEDEAYAQDWRAALAQRERRAQVKSAPRRVRGTQPSQQRVGNQTIPQSSDTGQAYHA